MLKNLRDLPDYHLAAGEKDIKGWALIDRGGTRLGEVDSLLVDPELDKEDARGLLPIRYMGVRAGTITRLVPVGMVDVDEGRRTVTLTRGAVTDFNSLPEYKAGEAAPAGKEVFKRLFPEVKAPTYERAEFTHEFPHLTLIEERLRVGKRETQIGEVVAKKRVEEVPVDERVTLRREHVEVERHAVNKPAEGKIGMGEQEIRMPVMAEEAVVEKVPYVKEEVTLRKEVRTEEKVIHDKVREEELEFVSTEPEVTGETRPVEGIVEKAKRELRELREERKEK